MKKEFVRGFARTLVPAYFYISRHIENVLFVHRLNSKHIKAPFHFLPVKVVAENLKKVARLFKAEFLDYSLLQYSKLIPRHYAKDGRAYGHLEDSTEAERINQFRSYNGRIGLFLKKDPHCFGYADGDSFLDVGCGPGQNIKVILERYPHAKINGFDLNQSAIEIIRAATKDNPNVSVQVGSVLDFDLLASLPQGSFDHVFISHVFGLLIDESVQATKVLRQRIVDELIRISKKSFLLMDNIYQLGDGEHWINIEQKQRCTFIESLAPYFAKHAASGNLKMLFSKENSALFFEKKN